MKKTQQKLTQGVTLKQQTGIVPSIQSFGNAFQTGGRRRTGEKYFLNFFIAFIVLFVASSFNCSAQQSSATERDGQHDFDFNIGTWKNHVKRLTQPLSGSTTWVKLEGIVTVRKIWDGKASLEEIEADGPTGHWEGATLFLYNPQSHQWSQSYVSSKDGTLGTPVIGEFKNGRGEFYGQDTYNGKSILVRAIWSEITPNSHKLEQAFSDDGGKTWETNFIVDLERVN